MKEHSRHGRNSSDTSDSSDTRALGGRPRRGLRRLVVAALGLWLAGGSGGSAQAQELKQQEQEGKRLFKHELFGTNGRTCETCHRLMKPGTIDPAQVEALFQRDPNDPLFRPLDSDDGVGNSYVRLRTHASIRVGLDLPPNVSILEEPGARTVVVNRGIPAMVNAPALERGEDGNPLFMYDGRFTDLSAQARGAVFGHFNPGFEPDRAKLEAVAAFQRTEFSDKALEAFASGGPAPVLPGDPGAKIKKLTDAEARGKTHFAPAGICGACHSGPMLNTVPQGAPPFVRPGARFATVLVSELNRIGNPVKTFVFQNPDGSITQVRSPDPGRALITGSARDANQFRILSLWGVKATAPYFHDNSAKTLEELLVHYDRFFAAVSRGALRITVEQQRDIVAFLKLL
jgi:cytochrome c peroxidase